MRKEKILALILAGGAGNRLGILTENRAKPVMPFAGGYRLIDFALSNCLHSRISDVWVIEQYELHSLNEHLSNGRPWDLDRNYGGLQVLPPFERNEPKNEKSGFASGNADALFRQLELIEEFAPDILIVMSADHVYKFDFRDAIETHLDKKAEMTMVTTSLPPGENASRFGVVEVEKNGRVKKFDYKPAKPQNNLVTTEIFVYDAKILIDSLKNLKKNKKELQDYGHELIPHLVERGKVYEHRLTGYWRDVGTIESYWQSQINLLNEKENFVLDDDEWNIITFARQKSPAFIHSAADVHNSLIAQGCQVRGRVVRSVLSTGAVIEKNAEVEDSLILPDATVEKGVKLKRVIVDNGVKVSKEKAAKVEAIRGKNKKAIVVIGRRKMQSSADIED